jgi:fumarate reductase flavoprotein subunit
VVGNDFDVIVIGGGIAGLTAAIAAREAGATVALLEARNQLGGSAALSGGEIYAAGTQEQRKAGIKDSPDDLYDYYRTVNQFRVEPRMVRTFADNAVQALEWAHAHGVQTDPPGVVDMSGVFRGHHVVGGGAGLIEVLAAAAHRAGVEIVFQSRVDELLVKDGRVVGVRQAGEAYHAGAVVVASGGFAQNSDLLHRYYPDALAAGDWVSSHAAPMCQGDALKLAAQVGADLTGDNRGLVTVRPRPIGIFESKKYIFVNQRGQRFMDEANYYSVIAHGIRKQPGSLAFYVFDEDARLLNTGDYDRATPFRRLDLQLDWIGASKSAVATGRIAQADTLSELAAQVGMDAEVIESTVAYFNADVEHGEDSRFFKPSHYLAPIRRAPFYAVEARPCAVVLTGYGIRIDPGAHVLTPAGKSVPGLYAAGEAVGNHYGEIYVASGSSICGGLVFGRFAGENAAAEARMETPVPARA